jgi:nucleoside-diphosphate-sugar epimerase
MTKIAVYGASGMIGGRMAAEALARGREVIVIIGSGGQLPAEVHGLVALMESRAPGQRPASRTVGSLRALARATGRIGGIES